LPLNKKTTSYLSWKALGRSCGNKPNKL
jgi:hypothetical protein